MNLAHELKTLRTLLRLSQADMATALGFTGPPSNRREVVRRIEAGEREALVGLEGRIARVRKEAAILLREDAEKALLSALACQHALAHARVDMPVLNALRNALKYEVARLRCLHRLPDGMTDDEIPAYVAAMPTRKAPASLSAWRNGG